MGDATRTRPRQEQRAEELTTVVDEALERLAADLGQGHTEGFREVLRWYAQFWTYSPLNTILIMAQRPDATRVASYTTWQRLGRQVAKGERAIFVRCPVLAKAQDPETQEEVETVVSYRFGAVFDAAQLTDIAENPLPSLFRPLPDDQAALYRRLVDYVHRAGYRVVATPLRAGVQGTSSPDGTITLNRALDSRNRLLTLLHETAHSLSDHHRPASQELSKAQVELEADAVSYVVGRILGIENPFTRDYIIAWKGDAALLRTCLGRIQRTVRQMVHLFELDKEEHIDPSAAD